MPLTFGSFLGNVHFIIFKSMTEHENDPDQSQRAGNTLKAGTDSRFPSLWSEGLKISWSKPLPRSGVTGSPVLFHQDPLIETK